jgi:crotonobetainyl-CoA:carnitine CoA-transferase CaiB-like acyl-CoA transferase
MTGPLQGVRIVDLTTMLSGPWATMMLADQGADVIKIEVPSSGDHVRSLGNQSAGMSAMFHNINRGKRSVTIDLKSPEGVDILKRIAATADVFVQNFRPGVVDRLGIGYEHIRSINASILYLSISGFGEVGPYCEKPVYDPVIQAVSSLASIQGGSDTERPRLVRTVLPDKVAAITAAQTISAGLFARARSGVGQHVKLSMLDAMLSFLWASDFGAQTYPDRPTSNQAAASFIDLIYETKDGYMTVAVMSDKEWIALTKAFNKPEWRSDERFATPMARDRHVNERLTMTQEVLRTRTTAEWMNVLEKAGVPCAPALTRSEVVNSAQVRASGSLIEYEHHAGGRLRQARPAAKFALTPCEVRWGAPLLGEHNVEVLTELGLTPTEIRRLRDSEVIGIEPTPKPKTEESNVKNAVRA